jgi:pyruvate kinase
MRPRYSQVFALCEREHVAATLAINWGTTAFVVPFDSTQPQNTIVEAIKTLVAKGHLHAASIVVVVGSIIAGDSTIEAVQMRIV